MGRILRFRRDTFLNADTLDADLVAATLNVVLKHEGDIEKARGSIAQIAQG